MTAKQIRKIIIKFLGKEADHEDLEVLETLLKDSENYVYFKKLVKVEQLSKHLFTMVDIKEAKESIQTRIEMAEQKKNKTRRKWFGIAASLVILIGLSIFLKANTNENKGVVTEHEPIEIGGYNAILTLEDGTQVPLDEQTNFATATVHNNGKRIVYSPKKTKTMAYNYLTIPRGGQYEVQLPDGTKVWMNSESKLIYPVSFANGETREVELVYGEAYFDVSPSENHNDSKFIVKTKSQNVIVTGTEFNIRAYEGDYNIFTTLVEGKVNVSNSFTQETLLPGQQSQLNIEKDLLLSKEVDVTSEIAWKNGIFLFKAEKLSAIMKKLSRWYNIDVVFKDKSKEHIVFSGKLKRQESIEGLLQNFEDTGDVSFSIENKVITIK